MRAGSPEAEAGIPIGHVRRLQDLGALQEVLQTLNLALGRGRLEAKREATILLRVARLETHRLVAHDAHEDHAGDRFQ